MRFDTKASSFVHHTDPGQSEGFGRLMGFTAPSSQVGNICEKMEIEITNFVCWKFSIDIHMQLFLLLLIRIVILPSETIGTGSSKCCSARTFT